MLMLVVLGILCYVRWEVWFGNVPEPPYSTPDKPQRILLTFGDEDMYSRNVSWSCGETLQASFLELADENDTLHIEATGEVFASRSGKAAYYVARLRGLQAGCHYSYRVCTNGHYSSWHHFNISDHSNASFLYVGDVQDTIAGITNQLLREAFRHHPEAQFLVCGGDLTERPIDAYWQETFDGLDSIGQSVPLLNATGNHDYLKGLIYRLERRFSLVHSYYLDSMEGVNQVFTLRYKDVQLFVLDSNREFFYLFTQRAWLKRQLEESTAKWKVVVLHHPLFSIRSKSRNLIQRWVFNDLLEDYGVDLVLQAHEHAYARMTAHEGGQAVTPVYTVSHCSPKNYDIYENDRYDKSIASSRFYQTVRISGDTLTLAAYEVYHHSLCDSLQIIKEKDITKIIE